MKYIVIPFFIIILSYSAYSQKLISIKKEKVEINNQKFYVENVTDERFNKKNIGEIWKGAFKKPEKIDIEGGLTKAAGEYFRSNFPKTSDNQIEVDVHIKYLLVKQGESKSKETGRADIVIEFKNNKGIKYEAISEIFDEVEDAFSTHEARIRRGFYECAVKFNNALKNEYREENNEEINNNDNAVEIVFDDNKEVKTSNYSIFEKKKKPENRNIIAVGYQIGGYNLIGVDYEVRMHDYFGVHFGGGFLGYTAGVKIHTNERTNSMFFNLSWKDGGLGQINGFGLEGGGRWVWSKPKDFGLIYQAGIFVINYISDDMKTALYGTLETPPVMFSVGIGLSW